eukprot:Gb_20636 [translate_table: standard]
MATRMDHTTFESLQELVQPHIDSFNYFTDRGLDKAVLNIKSVEIAQPEKPVIFSPDKELSEGVHDQRLLPYEGEISPPVIIRSTFIESSHVHTSQVPRPKANWTVPGYWDHVAAHKL